MSRGPGAGSLQASTAPSSDVDVALDGNLRHLESQHRPPNLPRTQAIAPKSQQLSQEIPPALPNMSSGPENNLTTPAGEHHRRSKSWTAPAPQSEKFAQSHGLPSTTHRSRYVLPAIPSSPSQVHWKAIRDHPSEFPGELSLTKDEVIIISKKFDNYWWEGSRSNGSAGGWVRASCLQEFSAPLFSPPTYPPTVQGSLPSSPVGQHQAGAIVQGREGLPPLQGVPSPPNQQHDYTDMTRSTLAQSRPPQGRTDDQTWQKGDQVGTYQQSDNGSWQRIRSFQDESPPMPQAPFDSMRTGSTLHQSDTSRAQSSYQQHELNSGTGGPFRFASSSESSQQSTAGAFRGQQLRQHPWKVYEPSRANQRDQSQPEQYSSLSDAQFRENLTDASRPPTHYTPNYSPLPPSSSIPPPSSTSLGPAFPSGETTKHRSLEISPHVQRAGDRMRDLSFERQGPVSRPVVEASAQQFPPALSSPSLGSPDRRSSTPSERSRKRRRSRNTPDEPDDDISRYDRYFDSLIDAKERSKDAMKRRTCKAKDDKPQISHQRALSGSYSPAIRSTLAIGTPPPSTSSAISSHQPKHTKDNPRPSKKQHSASNKVADRGSIAARQDQSAQSSNSIIDATAPPSNPQRQDPPSGPQTDPTVAIDMSDPNQRSRHDSGNADTPEYVSLSAAVNLVQDKPATVPLTNNENAIPDAVAG